MSDLFLPLHDKKTLQVFQPDYGYEYTEKGFPTGFLYRIDTVSAFPTVSPIELIYGKVTAEYMETFSAFYAARGQTDDFFVDFTDISAINPYLRINPIGKWVFDKPFTVNKETFGENFVDLSITIKQLLL
jgi:hypothetical protein